MIGLRAGLRTGLRAGLAAGLAADEKGGGPDCQAPFAAASGTYSTLYRPLTTGQYKSLPGSGILEPCFKFGCQDLAANAGITDAVSGVKMAATGAVTYGNNVTGWTLSGADRWIGTTEGANNQGFYIPKATPLIAPNASTQSMLICATLLVTSLSAERILFIISGNTTTSCWVSMTAAGLIKVNVGGVNSTGALVRKNATPTPFGIEIKWIIGGGLTVTTKPKGGTAETRTVAYTQQVGGGWGINVDVNAQPPNALWNDLFGWLGADAESMGARGDGATLTEQGW